jgi:predicted ATPase
MKIQVKNLGILDTVEIDLKPMTIFVGPNNSGKTLLAYVLLAIFGQTGFERYKSTLERNKIAEIYPPLDKTIQQLINEGSTKIDLYQFADEYAETYINNVAQDAKGWLAEFMQVQRFSFEELEIKIALEQKKEQMLHDILSSEIKGGLSSGQQRKEPLVNATKKRREQVLYCYTSGSTENLPDDAISAFVVDIVFSTIHKGFYQETRAFPTERTTHIPQISSSIAPFIEALTKNKSLKVSARAKRKVSIESQISGPLDNFLETMFNSIFRSLSKKDNELQKKPLYVKYGILAQILQQKILGGNLDVVSEDNLKVSRELIFTPKQDVALEMNIVSSMVKELAPLVLYLRYSARPDEWLIMDEPEMNLHPEAQVRLTELLAMLVNAEISLLFTTHSPYMVDHLVNLMKAYEHDDKESIKGMFYLQQTDAFISKEDVAVYLFEQGTAKNILGEDGIIQWGTFSRVSDRITQIYFDL